MQIRYKHPFKGMREEKLLQQKIKPNEKIRNFNVTEETYSFQWWAS